MDHCQSCYRLLPTRGTPHTWRLSLFISAFNGCGLCRNSGLCVYALLCSYVGLMGPRPIRARHEEVNTIGSFELRWFSGSGTQPEMRLYLFTVFLYRFISYLYIYLSVIYLYIFILYSNESEDFDSSKVSVQVKGQGCYCLCRCKCQ